MTSIVYFSLQNETSLLVKAKTPIDLPAFSNFDISCFYRIQVSACTCSSTCACTIVTIVDLISGFFLLVNISKVLYYY